MDCFAAPTCRQPATRARRRARTRRSPRRPACRVVVYPPTQPLRQHHHVQAVLGQRRCRKRNAVPSSYPFLADAGSCPGNCSGLEETTGAPSSFAVRQPRRRRASSRGGSRFMTESPSPLRMLLSRHTSRREFHRTSRQRGNCLPASQPLPPSARRPHSSGPRRWEPLSIDLHWELWPRVSVRGGWFGGGTKRPWITFTG